MRPGPLNCACVCVCSLSQPLRAGRRTVPGRGASAMLQLEEGYICAEREDELRRRLIRTRTVAKHAHNNLLTFLRVTVYMR
jgi:hypothetical protein